MVRVATGGRKKKLKDNMAATEVTTAVHRREVAATTSTTMRNVRDTVVALEICSQFTYTNVTAATQPSPRMRLRASEPLRDMEPPG
jgi:hypothetical protein